ncbi:sensor histidine kinase [Microbacterium sp.]|uniref:sensor histidine kinase n=1 Tax=Microbacterium sp. TaxID=51671 RepID=UPI002736A0A7|nr:histidine kinase [Microbacterium sp.]MDP3953004.1 histidine kinase [Microbacterium sp.]
MSTPPRNRREQDTWTRTLAGAIVAIAAGLSSRWLLVDAPLFALAIIAVGAVALILLAPRVSLLVIVTCVMVSAIVVQLPGFTIEGLALGTVAGLLTSLLLAGPLAVAAVLRHRREYLHRGWRLAALEADRRSSDINTALQHERMSLAAEMHDGLGHSLTLIAVRLGQLSLNPTLAPADRAAVADLRQASAEAAEELGVAVRLLRDPGAVAAAPTARAIMDSVESARSAGIPVVIEIPEDLSGALSAEAQTAVARLVQEALTNAAKHAPGEEVNVTIRVTDSTVVAEVSNAMSAQTEAGSPSSGGFGLVGISHRAAMLGGTLEVRRSPDVFALKLMLPADAKPLTSSRGTDAEHIVAAESEGAEGRAKAARIAIALPAAILGAVIVVTTGYLTVATMFSVMSPLQFAEVQPGDSRDTVEGSLPPFELLDAPREQFPPRSGEQCRYYESAVSFFERRDVYVICVDDDVVTRTGVVPAP